MAGTADEQRLFVMLKLIPEASIAQTRGPLAMAVVIDTSGSMREFADQEAAHYEIERRKLEGQSERNDGAQSRSYDIRQVTKLDQAIDAAHRLIDDPRLKSEDRLTVIHFDTEASTLLALSPLGGRSDAHTAVDSLRGFSGETFMARGMQLAFDNLVDTPPETAKRVFLLTDGATRDESKCNQLAGQFAERNTPVVSIGIGSEYNEELLLRVSETSRGRPYHLEALDGLQKILDAEVESTTREVVTDLRVTLATVKGVRLESISRVYPSLCDVELSGPTSRLGNITAGDYTVFVFEMIASGMARPKSRVRLAQVTLSGHVPGLNKDETFPSQDLFVEFTDDEAAIAAVDPEVLEYVQQKNVDRLLHSAVAQATKNAGQAKQTLQVAIGMTKRLGNAAMTKVLENALGELNASGAISSGTRKTVVLGGRTKTVKAGGTIAVDSVSSEEQIRKLSGL
jgi:Ca-activated chloride channel homolog